MKMAVHGIEKAGRTLATMDTDVGGQGWAVPPMMLLHNGKKRYHNGFGFYFYFLLTFAMYDLTILLIHLSGYWDWHSAKTRHSSSGISLICLL